MPARAAVILAAGIGTRLKSPIPKVLNKVGGRAIVDRVIDACEGLGCDRIVVVVGDHSPQVRAHVAARQALKDFSGDVLITNGDLPLIEPKDLEPLFQLRGQGARLAIMGFEPENQLLYGRIIRGADGHVIRIVEPKELNTEQAAVKACNAGLYLAHSDDWFRWLPKVRNDNAKGEYYLTDVVALASAEEVLVRAAFAPESSVMGADTQVQLSAAEAVFQERRRAHFLAEGVAMPAPGTVHFAWDTQVAAGATVEPYVVFGPGVSVETAAVIRAFTHLEGARVRAGALVGPYARLRPGADIGEAAHIGNFVEVKKVAVGKGAKANHLAYLGDGSVGAGANIGAGTIFCNYDGFDKYETHVGPGAFVGSDTALVAPVRVGEGAYIGSGSVITSDVSPDSLALARGRQVEKPGWAAAFRTSKQAKKESGQ